MPTKECDTCNNVKDVGEFNKTTDGACYNNCKDCFLDVWRKNQLEFWTDKNTRRCGICCDVVPLALYARDAHRIPYRNCRSCYSEETTREYTERQNAKAKAGGDATGGKPYNRPATYKKTPTKKVDDVFVWY